MRKIYFILFLICLLFISCSIKGQRPFVSDGCTLVPDFNFREAGEKHDHAYWYGGTKEERKRADKVFREEIKDAGHPVISKIYYAGVRLFGVWWLPTKWRWGFGHKWPKKYDN